MIKTIDFHIKAFFVVLLCFHFGSICAQDKEPSRLLLEKERDKILSHVLHDPQKSLIEIQDLQNKALKIGDLYFANHCDIISALTYYSTSDYQKALEYGNKALEEAKDNQFADLQATAMGIALFL